MDVVYRVLGVAARVGERGSRYRINLLPFNWIVMGLLLGGLSWCSSLVPDTVNNGLHPRKVALGNLLSDINNPKTYVTVSGAFSPTAGYTLQEMEDGRPTGDNTYYRILADPVSLRGILVKSDKRFGGSGISKATFSGLIETADSDLQNELEGSGNKFGPVTVDPSHVLAIEDKPANSTWLFASLALLMVAFSAMVITFLNRYMVFRRTSPSLTQDALARREAWAEEGQDGPDMPAGLRLTGPMLLPNSGAKRFLEVPVVAVYVEPGELAFVSQIDASNRFMGITSRRLSGIWMLSLLNGLAWDICSGFIYCGFGRRPAVRFSFTDAGTRKTDSAIISFPSPADRDRVLRTLALYGRYEIPLVEPPSVDGALIASSPTA